MVANSRSGTRRLAPGGSPHHRYRSEESYRQRAVSCGGVSVVVRGMAASLWEVGRRAGVGVGALSPVGKEAGSSGALRPAGEGGCGRGALRPAREGGWERSALP